MGETLDVGDAAGGQRAGQHHQTHSRHAERRGAGVCGPGKGTGEHTDGWYPSRFGHDRVVETPRGAGASISNPVDDGITLQHQRLERLRGTGGAVAELGRVDDLCDPIFLF